eukprot:6869786-Karenia_brevis.AAC.1
MKAELEPLTMLMRYRNSKPGYERISLKAYILVKKCWEILAETTERNDDYKKLHNIYYITGESIDAVSSSLFK